MSGRGAAIKAPADFLLKLQAHGGRRRERKKVQGKSKIMRRGENEREQKVERGKKGKLQCERLGNKNSTGQVRRRMEKKV